ncbi:FHA domain-containing protein [Frigoribacterium sp. Leaf164]|uniref:FHA domain-containing protein n=1 Tax=Frigoribacterium sp. Leaf164 TaxID=1736282 RepID=UPI000A447A75|nr:FHA domain-containing protein [Frigoribacterium sp. Leaf164]
MHCPTCASPLPVGAMFCGECGRAVTSADVQAARRAEEAEAARRAAEAGPTPDAETPSWRLEQPDRPLPGEQEPWWVRERRAPVVPPAWSGQPVRPLPTAAEAGPPVTAEPDDARGEPDAGRAEAAAPTPPVVPAPAPAPAVRPAPLRVPGADDDDAPRPTSAPLWTASLAPVPEAAGEPDGVRDDVADDPRLVEEESRPSSEAEAGEAEPTADGALSPDAVDAEPGDGEVVETDDASGVDEASETDEVSETDRASGADGHPLDAPGPSTPDADTGTGTDTGTDGADGASDQGDPAELDQDVDVTPAADDADGASAAEPEPASTPVPLREPVPFAPVAGDTAPVAPVPLVEPGRSAVVEHCTHCGAALHEDDIFCPECGAVVQSVALSFTGPIVPLPPSWTPPTTAASDARVGPAPVEPVPRDPEPRGPEPVEPAVEQPSPRPVTPPSVPAPVVPPAPPSPEASPWRPSPLPPQLRPSDDDVDATRLVRRGPVGTPYLLQFSTGESVTVDGSGLLGRSPAPQPGERFDQLVRIVDPGKSVSKTHLEFGQEFGALWISDRWSGNGTVVRPLDQPARRVEPGTRVRVARGTRVEIGEQFFVVS